ncbi:DUF397 domain-containing protein [Streptomyces sp. 7-21]|nr:DUF397 domain-containing protein [Streptomyces sp. 7-21]
MPIWRCSTASPRTQTSWGASSRRRISWRVIRIDKAAESVPVRDSKAPGGPVLTISAAAWQTFVRAVGRQGLLPG